MRKVWFITRPERDPKFHVDALRTLRIATQNFTVKWHGNRKAHQDYEKILAIDGLKRDNISHDGSGGRTWAAMLRTFGYVYLNSEGYLILTKVGEKILDSENIRENISKQILTLQIPNAYFLSGGFRPKFEDGFSIRPARFLIRLVNQSSLDYYVTKEEITFFVLTAKKDNELQNITKSILDFRKMPKSEKDKIKKKIAIQFDHRNRADWEARNFESAHGDVAHTFMLLCDYTGLVNYIRGDALRLPSDKRKETTKVINYYETRYPFNKRYLISLERFAENAGLDVTSYKASPFGALPPATNRNKSMRKVRQLLSAYPSIQNLTFEEITKILEQELSSNEARKYASEFHSYSYESLNEDFVESYLYEENDRLFEDKTGKVLEAIGFEVEMRPRPINEQVLTEIEILIHIDEKSICILDAKNYSQKFTLSSNLTSHMGSEYIPNYQGYKGKSVKYFGYIVANKFGGERNLTKIREKAKLINPEIDANGAIFPAKVLLGFLDYCLEHDISINKRKEMLISLFLNKGYKSLAEML